jgi:HEAT repeat protein
MSIIQKTREHSQEIEDVLQEMPGAKADPLQSALGALRGTPGSQERLAAMIYFRGKPDPRAMDPLIDILRTAEVDEAMNAALTLQAIGAAPLKELLVGLLGDSRAPTRRASAYLLGKIRDPSAREPLKQALGVEKEPEVEKEMTEALIQLQ